MTVVTEDEIPKRRYTATFPLPRTEEAAPYVDAPWPITEEHEQLLVFLQWEGFVKQAELESLELVEFNDLGEVAPEDVPRATVEVIGWPAREFVWRHFEGLARRPPLVNWLLAEETHEAGKRAREQAVEIARQEGQDAQSS